MSWFRGKRSRHHWLRLTDGELASLVALCDQHIRREKPKSTDDLRRMVIVVALENVVEQLRTLKEKADGLQGGRNASAHQD